MTGKDISGKIAIVGVAESDQIGKVPDKPAHHAARARRRARRWPRRG